MSKKKKLPATAPIYATVPIIQQSPQLFPQTNFKWLAIAVFVLAFGLYANTIGNQYTLDDGIVITESEFTKKGFAGISDILSNETFAGVAGLKTDLSGGRYRPLSVVTFAMEYGIFGARPSVSHLVNALLYGFLCVLIFFFLKEYVFKSNFSAALIASIIFAVHPLHTDVVSNIKGRDELLSLILLIGSVIFYLDYSIKKKSLLLVAALVAYFLSLLSKENGITFLAVIPLLLYFFRDKTLKQSLPAAIPFVLVFVFYLLIRLKITGVPSGETTEVMNAPFLLATGEEAFATKIMILGKDLLMLVYPHPLSYDYSYNQIPYVHFTDWKCILSLILNAFLVITAIRLFKRKHILSFAILFYYITLSIITNFVFDVGSPFNERFLFQPSLGFAIAAGFLLSALGTINADKKLFKGLAVSILALLVIAGSIKTISRNPDWKNNDSLFAADVIHAPMSAKTNNFAGVSFLRQSDNVKDSIQKNILFEKAIPGFKRSLEIYPDFADPNINLGNIYAQQNKLDLAKQCLMKAKSIHPDVPALVTNLRYLAQQYEIDATKKYEQGDLVAAIMSGNSSIDCFAENPRMLYNLGGYYVNAKNLDKAREVWKKALILEPGNANIRAWLERISTPQLPGTN